MAQKRLTKAEIERLKSMAKSLYIHEDITQQKALAARIGVSENTMSKWFKLHEDEWKRLKKNIVLTREERMADLYDELTEIANYIKGLPEGKRFADSKLGDVRRKLIKDIKELEVNASIPEVIAALTGLIKFIRNENLQEAKLVMVWADLYIKTLLK